MFGTVRSCCNAVPIASGAGTPEPPPPEPPPGSPPCLAESADTATSNTAIATAPAVASRRTRLNVIDVSGYTAAAGMCLASNVP